ncbi:MAG: hypothetical protein KatS3mg129_2235 [Leptospiraceae bacterium]|nr:MAG: hypothetical protein KatS3mg129_2235 [Leptospiraceae bacterium]
MKNKIIYYIILLFYLNVFYQCKTTSINEYKTLEIQYNDKKFKAQNFIKQASYYYQKKAYQKAIEYAKLSLNEFILFDGYYLIGMSYYQLNDFENGLESLLLAEKINPEHEQLLLTLGLIYSSLNQYEEALKRFEKLITIKPDDPYYLYRLGLTFKEMQKYEKAIYYLEKANKENFKYRNNVLLLLGDIYFELKEYDRSEYYYSELEKLKPDSKEVRNSKTQVKVAYYLEKGNNAFKNKKFKEAEENFKQIIQLRPESSIGYFQLGILYLELKNYDQAISNFKKALEISKDLDHFLYLCRTYLETSQFYNSLSCIKTGLQLYPSDEKLLNLLALYFKQTGNYKKSISILNRILSKNQNSLNTHKNLYLIYLEMGNLEKSKYHLEIIKNLDTNKDFWEKENTKLDALTLIKKGNQYLKNHQYNQAKKLYYKALAIYKHPEVYLAIGDLYQKLRNYKYAESNYYNALKISNDNIYAYEKLLDLYKKINYRKYKNLKSNIINKSKNNLSFGILYIKLLIQENNLKEALLINQKLLTKYPDSYIVKKQLAYNYYLMSLEENKNKRFQNALSYVQKALKLEPENLLYKNSKEIIQNNIKYKALVEELEKAEQLYFKEEYKKAKEIYFNIYQKWKKPLILVRLAEIEFYLGNEVEGYRLLENALKEKPKEIYVLEALYTRLLELNKLEEAEKGFKEILSIKEDAYYSYYKLGIIKLIKKEYYEALSYFEDAIIYNPDFLPSKIGYGLALYFLKDLKRSEEVFREISQQNGFGREIAILNLSLIYFNQNDNQKAKKELLYLIKQFPEYSDAYYHLAYIEYENRNFLEAERLLKKAISLQKRDVYFWALIKFYKETGIKSDELKQYCMMFLQTYPTSKFYFKVKNIYNELTNNQPFFEYTYTGNLKDYNILPYDNRLIFYNEKEIISIEMNTEKIFFHLNETDIKKVDLNQFLWIIQKNQIKAIDPFSGIEIWNRRFSYTICNVYNILPDLVLLISKTDCKKDLFLYYNDQIIKLEKPLISLWGNNLIFKKGNDIALMNFNTFIEKQNLEPERQFQFEKGEEILDFELNSNYFLIRTNKNIYVLNKDFYLTYKESLNDNYLYRLNQNYLVQFQNHKDLWKLNLLDLSMEKKYYFYSIDIDVLNHNLNNVLLQNEQIFYIDSEYNLNNINLNQKEKKVFKELQKFRKGIVKFHY